MAFELAAYGAVSGILYRIFPRRNWSVYVTLIAAMIVGRLVWGCVQFMMAGLQHTVFDRSLFLAGAVTNALPGILVQIILIPILVITMEKAKLTLNGDEIMTEDRIGKRNPRAAVCPAPPAIPSRKEDPSNTDGSSFQIAVSGRSSAKCSASRPQRLSMSVSLSSNTLPGKDRGFRRVRWFSSRHELVRCSWRSRPALSPVRQCRNFFCGLGGRCPRLDTVRSGDRRMRHLGGELCKAAEIFASG